MVVKTTSQLLDVDGIGDILVSERGVLRHGHQIVSSRDWQVLQRALHSGCVPHLRDYLGPLDTDRGLSGF